MIPGEIIPGDAAGPAQPGARPGHADASSTPGDRPVQVGSHYHFAAANPALEFDRDAAWGHRLDVPAGTAVRFEPGVDPRGDAGRPLAGRARGRPGCARTRLDGGRLEPSRAREPR